jgi:DNA polymerase II large subunit
MKFSTTPFKGKYLLHKYSYNEFIERGHKMAFLKVLDSHFYNAKIDYKFGLMDNENNYHWFFYGKTVSKNRNDALEIYNALLNYCNTKNLGKPFAFKNV